MRKLSIPVLLLALFVQSMPAQAQVQTLYCKQWDIISTLCAAFTYEQCLKNADQAYGQCMIHCVDSDDPLCADDCAAARDAAKAACVANIGK